jgi:hypothetical protein
VPEMTGASAAASNEKINKRKNRETDDFEQSPSRHNNLNSGSIAFLASNLIFQIIIKKTSIP